MKIIKFGAIWCPECAIMRPRWAEIEKEMPELLIEDIDYDKNPEIKKQYGIDHVPTFLFLDKDGAEITRVKGLVEKEELLKIINDNKSK